MALFDGYNEKKEVQKVIGKLPGWIQWGTTIILMAVAIIISASWFLHYPETIDAPVVINAPNAPIRVFPPRNGVIDTLLVKEGEKVKEKSILAVLKTPASWQDVLAVEGQMESLLIDGSPAASLILGQSHRMGTLQEGFDQLIRSLKDYQYFLEHNIYLKRMAAVQSRAELLNNLIASLKKQLQIAQDEVAVARKDLMRNEELLAEGVISETAFEQVQLAFYRMKKQKEALQAEIIQNEIAINELQGRSNELEKSFQDEKVMQQNQLESSIALLKNKISVWKEQNLALAPIAGTISFTGFVRSKKNIDMGLPLLAIVPEKSPARIEGKAMVAGNNFGKIQEGMPVMVKLESYPYQQFGMLEGRVKYIGLVPQDGNYVLDIGFPYGLQTSYKVDIPFKQEMKGMARIILKPKNLFQRITEQIIISTDIGKK